MDLSTMNLSSSLLKQPNLVVILTSFHNEFWRLITEINYAVYEVVFFCSF